MRKLLNVLKITVLTFFCALIVCLTGSAASFTANISNEDYRKILERKYGYEITIGGDILTEDGKNPFYPAARGIDDVELQILKDIESAFAMLPGGFIKELNGYLKSLGYKPSVTVRKQNGSDVIDNAGFFDKRSASITIVSDGDRFIEVLLHEVGHETELALKFKNNDIEQIEKCFFEQDKNLNSDQSNYSEIYISQYSSANFEEDFAETFALSVMQYRYISSYGTGIVKPIHKKIKTIALFMTGEFKTLKNAGFLLNCLPDGPSKSYKTDIEKAEENGIIPWNIYGLNYSDITRYDAALILQPFLYKFMESDKLNSINNQKIPENYVYDVSDPEDIFLLDKLDILTVGAYNRFNPGGKIQKKYASVIFDRIARLFGLKSSGISLRFLEYSGSDEKYLTYREFYTCLLKLYNLKEEYDKTNNILQSKSSQYDGYVQIIGAGTSLAEDGRIYYYSYALLNYTGKGIYISPGGNYIYNGDWKNGKWDGKGKITWSDGSWYEGDWQNGQRTGMGKMVWSDGSQYDGEWKDGNAVK